MTGIKIEEENKIGKKKDKRETKEQAGERK